MAVGGVGVMCSVWDLDLMSVSMCNSADSVSGKVYAGIGYTIWYTIQIRSDITTQIHT